MNNDYKKIIRTILKKEYDFTVTDMPGVGNDVYLVILKNKHHIVLYVDEEIEAICAFTNSRKNDKLFYLSDPNVFNQINQLFISIFGQ